MARSKNDPNNRKKEKEVTRACEFCGSNEGVHPVKVTGSNRKNRMAWACNTDKCVRYN